MTKQLDGMDQSVTYCSFDVIQKAPSSQTNTVEVMLFQLTQVVGGIIQQFEARY